MTPQPTAAGAGQVRTVPTDAQHRHDSTCYWEVDDCARQCVTYPLLRYALERCTATEQPVDDSGPEARP